MNSFMIIRTDVLLTTGLSYTLPGMWLIVHLSIIIIILYTSSYGSRQLRLYCSGNFERKRSDQLLDIDRGVWPKKSYM